MYDLLQQGAAYLHCTVIAIAARSGALRVKPREYHGAAVAPWAARKLLITKSIIFVPMAPLLRMIKRRSELRTRFIRMSQHREAVAAARSRLPVATIAPPRDVQPYMWPVDRDAA